MTKKTKTLADPTKDSRLLSPDKLKMLLALGMTQKYTVREIAKLLNVAPSTVSVHLGRADLYGLLNDFNPKDYSEIDIVKKCYPNLKKTEKEVPGESNSKSQLIPDYKRYALDHIELKIELKKLYQNYQNESKKKGLKSICLTYFYSRIATEIDKINAENPAIFLHWSYQFGLYAQCDFIGGSYKLATYNGIVEASIFTIAFPASYFVFAGFVTHHTTEEVCRVIADFVRYYGVVPVFLKVDNERTFVTAHRVHNSDVIYNKNFENYLNSLGVCLDAAPIYRGQSKSCVEYSNFLIQKIIVGKIREEFRTCTSTIAEHSKKLQNLIDTEINMGPFRKSSERTRTYLFYNYEIPACRKVELVPEYEGDSYSVKVPASYLIKVKFHNYSAPYQYAGKNITVCILNDFIVFKYENQEIARHIRQDNTPGNTVDRKHLPPQHQEIIQKNELFQDPNAILEMAKNCDTYVYRFCLSRIELDTNRNINPLNALRCCYALIKTYSQVLHKEILDSAITKVLNMPTSKWNSYVIKDCYNKLISEKIDFLKKQTTLTPFIDDDPRGKFSKDDLLPMSHGKGSSEAEHTAKTGNKSIKMMRADSAQAYLRDEENKIGEQENDR